MMINRKERRIALFSFAGLLLILAGYIVALHIIIPIKIRQQLQQISPNLQIKYSSIHTSLFASVISICDMHMRYTNVEKKNDSDSFHCSRIDLNGIKFLQLVLFKKFALNSIRFEKARISLHRPGKQDTGLLLFFSKIKMPFEKVAIGELELNNSEVILTDNREDHKLPKSEPMRANITEMKLTGLDAMQLEKGKLIADDLTIEKPEVFVSAYKNLKDYFEEVQLGVNLKHLSANKISFAYKNGDERMESSGDVSIEKLEIAQTNKSFTPDSFHFNAMHCNFSDITYAVPGKYHTVKIKSLEMDSEKRSMEIKSLHVAPQYSKLEYGKKLGYQANWIQSSVSEIKVIGLDVKKLLQQKFYAEKLAIGSCNTYVFRDRRLPRRQKNQLLPVAYIKSLDASIRVKTVTLEQSNVEVEEFPREWHKSGILKFERMQMNLSPFINHPAAGDPDHMDLNISGSVMGSGTAEAVMSMSLGKTENYSARGVFKNLDLSMLNSTAENLGDFHIRSGVLNMLKFEMTMTPQIANGNIIGVYHNLVVDKLKIDGRDSTKKVVAAIPSFMLRHVIIPKNKDSTLPEEQRTGKISYKRDPTRFVTFYFIKSLLDGIRASFTFGFVLPK